ncbi:MAG: glycosyltransferase family 4 protein [Rhodopirellula sp.]|nr:glycosyltransferase family 4 protein [Rhodopirellula sp.]
MRILYLHQHFTTPAMPGGTRSYEMARRFVVSGHEVHMITADRQADGGGWRQTNEAGIHVHWCANRYSNQMNFRERMGAFFRFAGRAAGRAASLPGDVIFASSTPLTIALPAVWAAKRKSIPMVFEVRDLWPEMPIAVGALRSRPAIVAARWLERFAYHHSKHVVALSPGMKEGVVATGYPEDRVTVIPNSCDLRMFRVGPEVGQAFRQRYAWLQHRPLVVYAGTLNLLNDVEFLARLAAIILPQNPEVRFLVVGEGSRERYFRELAETLGVLDRNFFMMPMLPKADMPAILSAADVATSLFVDIRQNWANSANKVFDALAAGRPVAINHKGWLADLIDETGCGLVLDPHDLTSSAGRLLAALQDRAWCDAARAAAARVAQERFDRDKLALQLESVLANAAGAAAMPAGRKAA